VSQVFFVPQLLLETLTSMEGMGIRRVMTHGVCFAGDGGFYYHLAELEPPRVTAARRPVVIDTVTDHRAFSPKTWTGAAGAH
jgi:hypothetical protein